METSSKTRSRWGRNVGAMLVVLALGVSSTLPSAQAFRDRDCSDFKTQKQAQRFFKKTGGSKKRDPHRLDSDRDGRACEELPRR